MMLRWSAGWSAALLTATGLACNGTEAVPDAGTALPTDAGADPAVVYYRDVKPIVDARCVGCHSEGNIAPTDFSEPVNVVGWSASIRIRVDEGSMPPWHPDPACNQYRHDRSLSDEERDTLLEWIELGAVLGDPSDEGQPLGRTETGLSRVDLRLPMPDPHAPEGVDEYRCFVIEWPETETRFITGFNLEPTNPQVVHHANIYAAAGSTADAFRQRAAAGTGSSYACFGGAFEYGVELVGAWAPGSLGIEYPADTGIQIEPGSVIVAEMHYNTGPGRSGPDQSVIAWQLTDSVARRALIGPFWNFSEWSGGNMPIPANDPDIMHRIDFDPEGFVPVLAPWLLSRDIQIWGVGIHMHYLGTSGSVRITRPDASRDECLLEIPDWDFNWQSGYLLEAPVDFTIGEDLFSLECHWDNTADNQPVIDGIQRDPRDANWGANSADEMCIGYVYITER